MQESRVLMLFRKPCKCIDKRESVYVWGGSKGERDRGRERECRSGRAPKKLSRVQEREVRK